MDLKNCSSGSGLKAYLMDSLRLLALNDFWGSLCPYLGLKVQSSVGGIKGNTLRGFALPAPVYTKLQEVLCATSVLP